MPLTTTAIPRPHLPGTDADDAMLLACRIDHALQQAGRMAMPAGMLVSIAEDIRTLIANARTDGAALQVDPGHADRVAALVTATAEMLSAFADAEHSQTLARSRQLLARRDRWSAALRPFRQ